MPGYKYSTVLGGAQFDWNDETLFGLFDKGPDIFLHGTKMPAQRIPRAAELRQLIDYMRLPVAPAR